MSNVYSQEPEESGRTKWAICVCDWEDGNDNYLGFGPFASIDDAHAAAKRVIPFQSYTLLEMLPVEKPRRNKKPSKE